MRSADLRTALGLTRSDWARALGVNVITVKRWEDDGADPGGLAGEVMRGISAALEDGADAARVGRIVSLGIASLLAAALVNKNHMVKSSG